MVYKVVHQSSIDAAAHVIDMPEARRLEFNAAIQANEETRRAADVVVNFGKYKGKPLSEIYEMDAWYVTGYLRKNDYVNSKIPRLAEAVAFYCTDKEDKEE